MACMFGCVCEGVPKDLFEKGKHTGNYLENPSS